MRNSVWLLPVFATWLPMLLGQMSCTESDSKEVDPEGGSHFSDAQSDSSTGCGNGLVDPGEWCDPGMPEGLPCGDVSPLFGGGTAMCLSDCTLDLASCLLRGTCGDGKKDLDELCDDGNVVDGDGCSATCVWESPTPGGQACGTTDKGLMGGDSGAPDTFCDNPANIAAFVPGPLLPIRLAVHVTSNSQGTQAATSATIAHMVDEAGSLLGQAGIAVRWVGQLDVIKNENLHNMGPGASAFNVLVGLNGVPDAVDVYIVNSWPNTCGKATDIGPRAGNQDAVVVVEGCGSPTLAHELGHLFGLWHTHHMDVGGACSTSGDFCCDTPRDPGPQVASAEGLGTCANASPPTCTLQCPDGSAPDTSNVMSYYDCANDLTLADFSACQRARIQCYVDRHYQYAMAPDCIDNDSDGFGAVDTAACNSGGADCDDNDPNRHPNAVELCNGDDDDCDLDVDEGLTKKCGVDTGECLSGVSTCNYGTWGPCEGEIAEAKEVCDGKDNDCDGQTDEGVNFLTEPAEDKCPPYGVCANGGSKMSCAGGAWGCNITSDSYVNDECKVVDTHCGLGATSDPTCKDNVDNDCDGAVDEHKKDNNCLVINADLIGDNCSTAVGNCEAGTYQCAEPTDGKCSEILVCGGGVWPTEEDCGGNDMDCDGYAGNRHDYDKDGFGDCPGSLDCDETDSSIFPGAPEECDGMDNDCDGGGDEGNPGGGAACGTGKPGKCAAGHQVCDDGGIVCQQDSSASGEGCNGIDDDCDGSVDEGDVCVTTIDIPAVSVDHLKHLGGDGDFYGSGPMVVLTVQLDRTSSYVVATVNVTMTEIPGDPDATKAGGSSSKVVYFANNGLVGDTSFAVTYNDTDISVDNAISEGVVTDGAYFVSSVYCQGDTDADDDACNGPIWGCSGCQVAFHPVKVLLSP